MTPQCPRPVGSAAKSSQTTYPHKIRGDSYAGEKRNSKKGKTSRRKYSFPENSLTAGKAQVLLPRIGGKNKEVLGKQRSSVWRSRDLSLIASELFFRNNKVWLSPDR
ncbi:hypothetical protein NPIL_546031 [Nephila pilipes]|uniref:Uncharacterized protein n=1 Tax=Nephila pilipes TaxID=299642 RepID=A0A8X6N7F2_NEPPI|nr:hypothetical protein NPIL_546031 [Nephila pilipes]